MTPCRCPEEEGCTNSGYGITQGTKFCMIASNICGFPVLNFLHVTLLAPRIIRLLLDFLLISAPWMKITGLLQCVINVTSYPWRLESSPGPLWEPQISWVKFRPVMTWQAMFNISELIYCSHRRFIPEGGSCLLRNV